MPPLPCCCASCLQPATNASNTKGNSRVSGKDMRELAGRKRNGTNPKRRSLLTYMYGCKVEGPGEMFQRRNRAAPRGVGRMVRRTQDEAAETRNSILDAAERVF